MSPAERLETIIRSTIPLSVAMDFRIRDLGPRSITVAVPLGPNVNIHGTGFAGSIYATGILAAWGLGTHLLESAQAAAELVVSRASIRYAAPVRQDFAAVCAVDAAAAQAFLAAVDGGVRGRLALEVSIGVGPAAVLEALLVASPAPGGSG